jgi:glutaredoxin
MTRRPATNDRRTTAHGSDAGVQGHKRAILGTLLLGVFLVLATLLFVEGTGGLPFRMPRSWYVNGPLWYGAALASLAAGAFLLANRPAAPDWRPTKPGRRFGHVVLFTREGCHLCDDALAILEQYRRWLPPIETVDVDIDPRLAERFGETVPVVEFDGAPRFKGRIDEFALRRLIEGTPPEE